MLSASNFISCNRGVPEMPSGIPGNCKNSFTLPLSRQRMVNCWFEDAKRRTYMTSDRLSARQRG